MITKNTDSIRYTTGGVSNVSIDTKQIDPMMNDDPMQDYEEVEADIEVNPLPIPPKPKAKTAPKKSAVPAAAYPKKYTSSGYSQPVQAKKPPPVQARKAPPHAQYHGHYEEPIDQPIYESPDD